MGRGGDLHTITAIQVVRTKYKGKDNKGRLSEYLSTNKIQNSSNDSNNLPIYIEREASAITQQDKIT